MSDKYFRLNINTKGITKYAVNVVRITAKNLVVERDMVANRHVPLSELNRVVDKQRFMDFTPDLVCWCDEAHVDECIKLLQEALAKWITDSNKRINNLQDQINSYAHILVGPPAIKERAWND